MSKQGFILTTDENGNPVMVPVTLPIQTNASVVAWSEDMLRKINEFSSFRKFLLRLVLGRYAYRELVGLRDCLEELGWSTTFEYGLEGQKYHMDKVRL